MDRIAPGRAGSLTGQSSSLDTLQEASQLLLKGCHIALETAVLLTFTVDNGLNADEAPVAFSPSIQ